MERTLRDTIKEITRLHLSKGYLAFGQCLTAVGWVNGTVPELTAKDGLVELPMSDVMAGGVVVGAAIVGRRPIYIVRYQGFQWFNAPIIANYAGKSKELWGQSCPIFIRSLAMEGGIGPVAGSSHHGIFNRMPGVNIISPMTPNEYTIAYESFMNNDEPYYVSEHRKSYDVTNDFSDYYYEHADISIFAFSITRLEMIKLQKLLLEKNIYANIFHQLWMKPLKIEARQITYLDNSTYGGLVLDDDYANGLAKTVACDLMIKCSKKVRTLCIDEKAAGFSPHRDNLPPSAEKIADYIYTKIIGFRA
jgi:acetoin:2,6-dichlorophenolindophenol oxidoreductase subunit beta